MIIKTVDKKQTKLCNALIDKRTTKTEPHCYNNLTIFERVINLIWQWNVHSYFLIYFEEIESEPRTGKYIDSCLSLREMLSENVQVI